MLPFSLPHTPGKCNAFEGSSQLSSNFTWGSAQARETAFLGSLPQALLGNLRTNQGNYFLGEVFLKLYWGSSAQARETAFLGSLPQVLPCGLRANSGKKPTLFYTDTLRGFRAQGCASDRHKAPRSSLEEARWGDWRLIGARPGAGILAMCPCRRGSAFSRGMSAEQAKTFIIKSSIRS